MTQLETIQDFSLRKSTTTLPRVIDMDYIKELRLTGYAHIAAELIQAHQKSLKQLKVCVEKEYRRDCRKKAFVKHICTTCLVRPTDNKYCTCEACRTAEKTTRDSIAFAAKLDLMPLFAPLPLPKTTE